MCAVKEKVAPSGPTLLLSPGKAAEVIGVNRKTVQRWLDRGMIPVASEVGRLRLISADEVDQFKAKRDAKKAARRAKAEASAA